MTQKSKYDPIIDTLPGTQDRKEILFRVAGDDQIQVEYGRTPRIDYMDMFRVILVAAEVERRRYEGYTQTEGIKAGDWVKVDADNGIMEITKK